MQFKDGFIGMLVRIKDDEYAYICGIGLNGAKEPLFKIKRATYDFDNYEPGESEIEFIHPRYLEKLE